MPTDPRVWFDGPMSSSYPACMAVKAAAEQAADGGYAYLRALREGIFCHGRKLDTTEALVEEARGAGLAVERFRVDLGSHAIVESFGADLEIARDVPPEARTGGQGALLAADGPGTRAAAHRCGSRARAATCDGCSVTPRRRTTATRRSPWVRSPPASRARVCSTRCGASDAWRRRSWPWCATCPRRAWTHELAQLALEWRVRPLPVLAGRLWELA